MAFEILTADQLIQRLKGRKYKYSQIHHTWKPNHANFDGKNHIKLQQGMYNSHVHDRGWDDIGQHATLMPDGTFVTGRPFNKTPAGISGYNTGAFMIEMLGDFDEGKDKLEGKQLESMLKVQNFLITECGATIMFHREHAPKTCPGTGLNKAEFITQVKNYTTPTNTTQSVVKQSESTPKKPESAIGTIKVLVNDLWYYNKPNWDAKKGKVHKNEVFTIVQELIVDGAKMYKLLSGNYITSNKKYVKFTKK